MSVVIYVKDETEDLEYIRVMDSINPILQQWADVHLIYQNTVRFVIATAKNSTLTRIITQSRYPVNTLRNEGINNARTDYVLVLDADMIPNSDLRAQTMMIIRDRFERNDSSFSGDELYRQAYVVPAFDVSWLFLIDR